MSQAEVLKILSAVGAIIPRTHIVFTSGKHGDAYVNKKRLYPDTTQTSRVCRLLALEFIHENIDVVVAPALGGIVLSQWVANHLTQLTGRKVFAVFAEKDGKDGFVISEDDAQLLDCKRVLALDDILNTGKSTRAVVQAVRRSGGIVTSVGALLNRGDVTVHELGSVARLVSLVNMKMNAWEADECPLCKMNVPINITVGHGRAFLQNKGRGA